MSENNGVENTTPTAAPVAAPTPKRRISTKTVIDMLRDGKDRDQIKRELNLTPAEARALFSHKDIIKKKVHKPVELGIEIVGMEDEEGTPEVSEEETVNVAPATAPAITAQEEFAEFVEDEPEVAADSHSFLTPGATTPTPPDSGAAAPAAAPAFNGWG